MHAKIKTFEGRVEYDFKLDDGDGGHPDGKTKMENISVYFKNELINEDIHNDILCLVALLIVNPFISNKLSFSIPVSNKFVTSANKMLSKYKIKTEIDYDLSPREMPNLGRPGLAFSGGCDSSAALCIMPPETVPVFLERPMSESSSYNSDAALMSCELVRDLGFHLEIVESNFEYLRNPIGFPSDLAHASVLLLLADIMSLDSVNFGTVLESSYGIGHENFRDYGNGSHWRFFSTLFDIVGIELSLPVCGISEVGTAIICKKSPMGYISQSCIRGNWSEPCLKCWKCFRKQLLSCGLGYDKFQESQFLTGLSTPDVVATLKKIPISHENVLRFSINKLMPQENKMFNLLEKRLLPLENTDFLKEWYSPSIYFVSKKYREIIKENILEILDSMNSSNEKFVEAWNLNKFLNKKSTITNTNNLISKVSE